jgi:excisionase family DNA binding protein
MIREESEKDAQMIARAELYKKLLDKLPVVEQPDKLVTKDYLDTALNARLGEFKDYLDLKLEKLSTDLGLLYGLVGQVTGSERAPSKDLLNSREAAQYVRVTVTTINRWAQEGTLPSIKNGGGTKRQRRLFHRSALDALMQK